jgi:2',3'-cyclic-nucleotide 2'-phosphodiesterase (5'-nucleotidase family)
MEQERGIESRDVNRLSRRAFLGLVPPVLLAGCRSLPVWGIRPPQTESVRRLIVLYTNDEHGWMEPTQESGGAAGMVQRWKRFSGLGETEDHLILSGGDMWTGPAISTNLEGESMTDIMNRMGYAAAALGNHDFDFGSEVLQQRAQQAQFPFLSANVRKRGGEQGPPFAQPFSLHQVNGIRVAVIGLTTVETQLDTRPSYVQEYSFWPYEKALHDVMPAVRAEDPDLVLLVGHICHSQLRRLADSAANLGIPLLTGGHCHEEHNVELNGVQLVESGFFMKRYVEVELFVDLSSREVAFFQSSVEPNTGGPQDEATSARVAHWKARTDPKLWEVIGFTEEPINRRSLTMDRLIADAWLHALPHADVAIASRRYVQQSIPAGEITAATIMGVLPVDNVLMEIELRGGDLARTIRSRRPLLGGVEERDGRLFLTDGSEVDAEATYRVILPDVIYYGANYYEVQELDPEPLDTGISWRQPVIDYLLALGTSETKPLIGVLAG